MAGIGGRPDEARWLRRPAQGRAGRSRRESVSVRGGTFEVILRACDDGGCVALFPALPQLMTRGASRQHARLKALALAERYLRTLADERQAAAIRAVADRRSALPLAA
jgi:predicted RNase H-like HicB family nuclease